MDILTGAGSLASIVGLAITGVIVYFSFFRRRADSSSKKPKPSKGQARTVCAIVYKGRLVLMVKRRGIGEPLTWYFPSGSLRSSDSLELRAIEEVRQETGIECRYEKKIGERNHPDTAVFIYYLACSYVSGEAQNLDDEENSEVEWVLATEAKSRISTDLSPEVETFLNELSVGKYE